MALGSLGMVLLPELMLLWAVVSGFFSASSLLLALTMISLRAAGPQQVNELSGMAQGVGYVIGGAAPRGRIPLPGQRHLDSASAAEPGGHCGVHRDGNVDRTGCASVRAGVSR
ncbi:hypothetical protein [Nesterenkonia pannonica]|uniref:hypothetical protein n=1 Tax=Nesterenkonia pannonica TaxID=1548602 RepID=UPI0021641553|nr:hypothetical protein [Nesterenkonia pannonica]